MFKLAELQYFSLFQPFFHINCNINHTVKFGKYLARPVCNNKQISIVMSSTIDNWLSFESVDFLGTVKCHRLETMLWLPTTVTFLNPKWYNCMRYHKLPIFSYSSKVALWLLRGKVALWQGDVALWLLRWLSDSYLEKWLSDSHNGSLASYIGSLTLIGRSNPLTGRRDSLTLTSRIGSLSLTSRIGSQTLTSRIGSLSLTSRIGSLSLTSRIRSMSLTTVVEFALWVLLVELTLWLWHWLSDSYSEKWLFGSYKGSLTLTGRELALCPEKQASLAGIMPGNLTLFVGKKCVGAPGLGGGGNVGLRRKGWDNLIW